MAESGGSLVQNMLDSYAPGFVYIPYNVLQENSGKSGYDRIAVTLSDPEAADQEGEKLADALARQYGEQTATQWKICSLRSRRWRISPRL